MVEIYGRNSKTSLLVSLLIGLFCSADLFKNAESLTNKTALFLSVLNASASFKDFPWWSKTDGITGNCV